MYEYNIIVNYGSTVPQVHTTVYTTVLIIPKSLLSNYKSSVESRHVHGIIIIYDQSFHNTDVGSTSDELF